MPEFKLTRELFVKFRDTLSPVYRENDCRPDEDDKQIRKQLQHLLDADNARELLESFKKVYKDIQERFTEEDIGKYEKALTFLVHLFFISTSKNPLRRVLISAFQNCPEKVKTQVIRPSIIHALEQLYATLPPSKTDGSSGHADSTQAIMTLDQTSQIRHSIDTISAITENFSLGVECVSTVCLQTLQYLSEAYQSVFRVYQSGLGVNSQQLSPMQQNEIMHHCLETVKLTNRICQKTQSVLESKLQAAGGRRSFEATAAKCIRTDISIIQSSDFLLDCKTTSSMNVCLMLKYSSTDNSSLPVLSQCLFRHINWSLKSHTPVTSTPDWLIDLNIDQLSESNLSSSSYLSCCYGLLAMVAMEELLCENEGSSLFAVLLEEFLELSKRCSDVGSKLLAAKSICLLTHRTREYLEKTASVDADLACRLHGESVYMQAILNFVFTAWEDAVDAVRFTVRDVFQNVVSIHLGSCKYKSGAIKDDVFLQNLSLSILNDVSWSCKGKYGTLSVLVGHLGSTRMLQWHAGIARKVLQQLHEQTLACYASELYEKLFTSHMTGLLETDQSEKSMEAWFREWVEPVLEILCDSNTLQKKHTIEYVLPRLLKSREETFHYIIDTLTTQLTHTATSTQAESRLGALILCLRRARALGQLKVTSKVQVKSQRSTGFKDNKVATDTDRRQNNTDDKETASVTSQTTSPTPGKWYGIVDVDLLEQALVCMEEQVRLDAFALLCENQKTSEVISSTEIELVKSFIPDNLNNQNPAFRQQLISLEKKFLSRMKESRAALKRLAKRLPSMQVHLQDYQSFLMWLTRCILSNLYPGSVFARRTTCLSTLTLLMDLYGEPGISQSDEYWFYNSMQTCDVYTLLSCLTDTFEDNKQEAANILIAYSKMHAQHGGAMDATLTEEMFLIALRLSGSTRPQDSTTAAYLCSVLTHQPRIHDIISKHLHSLVNANTNGNETVIRKESGNTNRNETSCHQNETVIRKESGNTNGNETSCHQNETVIRKESGLATETDKGASSSNNKSTSILLMDGNILGSLQSVSHDELGGRYGLSWILMDSLEWQCRTAQTSLMMAAANKPMYPTIQCMRYCFTDVNFRNIPEDRIPAWRCLLAQFVSLCMDISAVVSPVVCNSSPEGNVPMETIPDIKGTELCELGDVNKSQETVMLMPEYLTVCCWRSVKEISLLLGQLTSNLPLVDSSPSGGLLTYEQVMKIGEYFSTLLLESKHRGAFELAYAGFVKLTEMLWRSSSIDLHQLPNKWLSDVMCDIKSGDPQSRLCATRRSAGVPFYVQALVTTEPSSTGRQCFRMTMQELLALALDESIVTLETSTAKVHALNILRALYKDSKLKDDVAPYIADGLKVAILGFKSPLWAVRNSATLLMTAMMNRVFGVKRSKDESSFSRKNCQTGRTFFYKYPSLYQFLLTEIATATEHIYRQLHPGLYPILMVLGRLFPSAMDGTDTSLNLAAFIPFVIKCNASPVLKTRVMAAKALQPLVDKDHVIAVFTDLLTLLPCQQQVLKQNQIHGTLLQLEQMFRTVPMLPQCTQTSLAKIIYNHWLDRMIILTSHFNNCLLTKKLVLEVTFYILQQVADTENKARYCVLQALQDALLGGIQACSPDMMAPYDISTPCLSEYQVTVCRLCMKLFGRQEILTSGHFNSRNGNDFDRTIENMNGSLTAYVKGHDIVLHFLSSNFYEVRYSMLEEMMQIYEDEACLVKTDDQSITDKAVDSDYMTGYKATSVEIEASVGETDESIYPDDHSNSKKPAFSKSTSADESAEKHDDEIKLKQHEKDGEFVSPGTPTFGDKKVETTGPAVKGCYPSVVSIAMERYEKLVSMLETETDEDCLENLYRLLQNYPVCVNMLKAEQLAGSLKTLLHKIEDQSYSDKVQAAAVAYAGTLLHQLHAVTIATNPSNEDILIETSATRNNPSLQETMTTNTSSDPTLLDTCTQLFVKVVRELTSFMETDSDILLACSNAVKANFDHLRYLKGGQCSIYRCVLDLLQADDLGVRESTAGIVDMMSLKKTTVRCQPYVAISELFRRWIDSTDMKNLPTVAEHIINDIICDSRSDTPAQEERLFDKGEINTYWDEFDLIKTQGAAVHRCLSHLSDKPHHLISGKQGDTAVQRNVPQHLQSTLTTLKEFLTSTMEGDCLATGVGDCIATSSIATRISDFRDIFFSNQQYQRQMIGLYRTCVICQVAGQVATLCGCDVLKNLSANVLEKLRSAVTIVSLPPHIRDVLNI